MRLLARDLKKALDVVADEAEIILIGDSGEDYEILSVLRMDKPSPQVWITFGDPSVDFGPDDGDEDEDWGGDPTVGDMCALPEVSGDSVPLEDVCEIHGRGKSKRA
jgi:hypothetical protein